MDFYLEQICRGTDMNKDVKISISRKFPCQKQNLRFLRAQSKDIQQNVYITISSYSFDLFSEFDQRIHFEGFVHLGLQGLVIPSRADTRLRG